MSRRTLPGLPGMSAALERLASFAGVSVTAGVQGTEGGSEGAGGRGDGDPATLVDIAVFNEYGTATIPPRPWLRTALDTHRDKWGQLAKVPVKQAVQDRAMAGGQRGLQRLAVVMAGDVKESLLDGEWTPNAESTIKRKGSDQPLVDTGRLVQSQRGAVVIKGRTFIAG